MAIDQAMDMNGGESLKGLIHHSDRGVQYCCDAYVQKLQEYDISISMTEDYKPTDNAIAERVNRIIKDGKENITEEDFSKYLYNDFPDPDLVIRTSGEMRVSNFLLWQIAYSELYITDTLWPDFDEKEIDKAIESYNQRERRFGGVKNV